MVVLCTKYRIMVSDTLKASELPWADGKLVLGVSSKWILSTEPVLLSG